MLGRDRPLHGFWGSSECQRIDKETSGELKRPDSLAFHLGVDWMQPFAGCVHSTGFGFIK